MPQLTASGYAIQRVNASATGDGDNTVIAAPGVGKAILVLGMRLRAVGAATLVIVKSGAAGTVHADFTAAAAAPGAVLQLPSDVELGVFQCDANQALVINNTAGVDTFGPISYRIISV